MKKILFIALLLCTQPALAQHTPELAPSPPMGWNSWNWFGKKAVNAKIVREVIDSMAAKGLKKAGYKYVVVDGGWRAPKLGPRGKLKANGKFPKGMKALADYAHSKGFKFGLHTVPGTADCGGDPVGGFGHEKIQVHEFVQWGIDFIKLDQCRYKPGWTKKLVKKTYLKWDRLLENSGRNILLSIHVPIFDSMPSWIPKNFPMARLAHDIRAKIHGGAIFEQHPRSIPLSVMGMAGLNNRYAPYAGDDYWNFPDMLVVGNPGLTLAEQKVHFALWCIMTSPLILGNDPRHMSPQVKAIITNKDAIAIDQDPTEQGTLIKTRGDKQIWTKQLKDGRQAVLMINLDKKKAQNITLQFIRLGITGKAQLKDIYAKKDIGIFTDSFTRKIQPHAGLFFLVSRISQ
jgi:alpha-galactosidase